MNRHEQKIEFNSAYISKRRSRLRTVHKHLFEKPTFRLSTSCLLITSGWVWRVHWVISIVVRVRGLRPRHFVLYRLDDVTIVMWLGVDNSLEPSMELLLQCLVHDWKKNAVDEIESTFFIKNWLHMTQEGACQALSTFSLLSDAINLGCRQWPGGWYRAVVTFYILIQNLGVWTSVRPLTVLNRSQENGQIACSGRWWFELLNRSLGQGQVELIVAVFFYFLG